MDTEDRIKLAEDANTLLNNNAFKRVMKSLREDCIAELLAVQPGDLTVSFVHARMCAVEDVEAKLRSFITDGQIARRK